MNYQAWEECRKSLELELNQDEFSTWISPLAYSEEQDEFGMQAVTLLAPNDFIKEHVKQNLAAHEYPRLIEFVEELPLTTTGKIKRNLIRKNHIEVKNERKI